VIRSARVLTPDGETAAAVHVNEGRITAFTGYDDLPPPEAGAELVELGDQVVMPGLVDSHVHVNEPGRTEWEGFTTATRAAAAGGVTTIVDMPLNCIPPTTTVAALDEKRAVARGRCQVDVAFWGGIVPGNRPELTALADAGVCGFKAFLCDSGVPEFPPVSLDELDAAMAALAGRDTVVALHAELPGPLAHADRVRASGDPRRYGSWLGSRPADAETQAVAAAAELAGRHGVTVHILHLSAAGALEEVRAARARGVPISAETCPHYLTLAAEDVPDGATAFKCAPPIREAANAERLWEGLADGTLDVIASDHSPSPPAGKHLDDGDFVAAWGGISSLQLGLPLVWTAAAGRGHQLADVARWMSSAPARLAGLPGKGAIGVGRDADLVAFDPEATWTVDAATLQHRHAITPYDRRAVRGRVRACWVGGRQAYRDDAASAPGARLDGRAGLGERGGGVFAAWPRGALLRRGAQGAKREERRA
jgi:allantoinase